MARRETSGLAQHVREATGAGRMKMRRKRPEPARVRAVLVEYEGSIEDSMRLLDEFLKAERGD